MGVIVSVVMPVLNGATLLAEQLAALAAQQFCGSWEIIIADNGSTDPGVLAVCAQYGALLGLAVVDASGRRGGAHARNVGAASARGELLAFCDADDVVKPGWLQRLVAAARDHDVVAGSLDYKTLNAGIPIPDYWTRVPQQLGRKLAFLPSGATCNMLVRRKAFDDLGGFSEDYAVAEDVDFFWRVQLAGLDLGYAPDAQIEYRLRRGSWDRIKRRYAYAKDDVHLYRVFRTRGMPRDSWPRVGKDWARNIALLPACAFSARCRHVVAERLPARVGRLVESVHSHVLFL
jgi:GT2 family glycosyltransferase